MALDPVLRSIPGLAGYLAQDQYSRGQEAQEAQTIGLTAKLADHFREENFRRGITPGMGNDEILSRAIRSVGPDKAATLLQNQSNLAESRKSREGIALAQLSARMMKDREALDIAARNATTHEQRARIAEARAKMDAHYRGQSAAIASGKHYDETGVSGVGGASFDIGSLLTPPSGPVAPSGGLRPLPPGVPETDRAAFESARGGVPAVVDRVMPQAEVDGMGPQPRLEAALSPQPAAPVQPAAAPNNLDARDLGAQARGPVVPAPGTPPKVGLPPEVQALIDREPSPKKKRELEQRYVMAEANKKIGINLAGGRESVFINRVVNSGNQAAADLENVVKMPLTVSRGIFGGRTQGGSLFEAGKETLANTMTTEDVQLYNTFATGFQRALAAIEGAGLAPTNALMHQMDQVIFKEGDTNFVKLAKLAQTRQIVEKGLDTVTANSRVDPGTKKLVEEIIGKIRKSVPFTGQDLLKLRKEQQINPNISLADVVPALKKKEETGGWSIRPK